MRGVPITLLLVMLAILQATFQVGPRTLPLSEAETPMLVTRPPCTGQVSMLNLSFRISSRIADKWLHLPP